MSTALITGASGGLGEQFAWLLAADHHHVVLVARSKEKMETLAKELSSKYGIRTTVLAHDLSQKDAVESLIKELQDRSLTIDILINNAGFGAYGKFHETGFEHEKQLLQVNIEALTELTKALLPDMVKRKSGKVLNVASTAAFASGPLMAVYYASKAYVLSLSIALNEELKGTGVTVTCLCPGPTKTGFETGAGMQGSRLFKSALMDAKTVSAIGYRAMLHGKPLVVAGLRNKISAFGTRLVPRWLAAKIARAVQAPIA
jgi:short-subunit dehydrogenase